MILNSKSPSTKFDLIIAEAELKVLGSPVRLRELQEGVENIYQVFKAGVELKRKVNKEIYSKKIKLVWSSSAGKKIQIYGVDRDFHPLEIADSLFQNAFVCFGPALYWNGLTDQIPNVYFIAKERKKKAVGYHYEEIDDFYLMDQFMRPPRPIANRVKFNGITYTIVERDFSGRLGVVRKSIQMESAKLRYGITDKERTVIDSIVFPERSGGIKTVIDIVGESLQKLSPGKLIDYYSKLEFTYPYWQRIGLIFDRVGGRSVSLKFMESFGKPRLEFFLDRQYKVDWSFDSKWKVYYPKGIFGED